MNAKKKVVVDISQLSVDGEDEPDNLAFWRSVADIKGCPTKPFDKKTYKGTSWDPTWAKMKATELWGEYGKAWGLKDIQVVQVPGENAATVGILLGATFWSPISEFEIWTDGKYVPHTELLKKLQTDAIKKALTMLGFAASIYLGKFDDDPHGNDDPHEGSIDQRTPHEFAAAAVRTLNDATSMGRVSYVEKECRDNDLKAYYMQQVLKAAHEARVRIQAGESEQEASDLFGGKDDDGKEGQAQDTNTT